MKTYPEIEALKAYVKGKNIAFQKVEPAHSPYFFPVAFTINHTTWKLYIDDEYEHFNPNNHLLCFFLILNALEDYAEASDYLVWCTQYGLDSRDLKWLNYYRGLDATYHAIAQQLGPIDACITPLDYQLMTGVAKALVERDYSL